MTKSSRKPRDISQGTQLIERNMELLRASGTTARDIAKRADIDEATFSKIRRGVRHPSRETVKRLAAALKMEDPNNLVNAFGYPLEAAGQQGEPRIIYLRNMEGLLAEEKRMIPGDEVWSFFRIFLQLSCDASLSAELENLKNGVKYTYFCHVDSGGEFLSYIRNLKRASGVFFSANKDALPKAILLPDLLFPAADKNFFQCVFHAQDKDRCKAFRTSLEPEDGYRYYQELPRAEGTELRNYLKRLKETADSTTHEKGTEISSPILASNWIKVELGTDAAKDLTLSTNG